MIVVDGAVVEEDDQTNDVKREMIVQKFSVKKRMKKFWEVCG